MDKKVKSVSLRCFTLLDGAIVNRVWYQVMVLTPRQLRDLLANGKAPTITRTEITRSFSYKLNVGNYESRDFFCSQKVECDIGEAEAVSRVLHEFCRSQVMAAVEAELQLEAIRKKKEKEKEGNGHYRAKE